MDRHERARQLRQRMTDAERRLWYRLRAGHLGGQRFRRQQPIGRYIVDFVHLRARLIVEADGGQHVECRHDQIRDAWLESQGFQILRFWNDDILLRTDAVLEEIWRVLQERLAEKLSASPPPHPPPLSHKGRGEPD